MKERLIRSAQRQLALLALFFIVAAAVAAADAKLRPHSRLGMLYALYQDVLRQQRDAEEAWRQAQEGRRAKRPQPRAWAEKMPWDGPAYLGESAWLYRAGSHGQIAKPRCGPGLAPVIAEREIEAGGNRGAAQFKADLADAGDRWTVDIWRPAETGRVMASTEVKAVFAARCASAAPAGR